MTLIPLDNTDFEAANLVPWQGVDNGTASCTFSQDAVTFHSGAKSAKIVNTAAGEDDYLVQNSATDPDLVSVIGRTYTLTAYLNCTAFTAGALANRGLGLVTDGADSYDNITSTTGGWVLKTVVRGPVTTVADIQIRLYAPQGTVYWDDVQIDDGVTSTVILPQWPRIRFNG